MEISPDGATLTAPQPLRQLRQPAGASADVPGLRRRADGRRCSTCPGPKLEGGKPIVVACPMSEEQAALQQELVDPLRAAADRRRSIRGRTTPWPSPPTAASWPSTPGCCPAGAEDFPGSKINALVENVAAIWQQTRRHARHADDLLRHGREPHALGLFASMTRSSTNSSPRGIPREQIAADRRRRFRRQETGAVRAGPQRRGARADRQHAEDGHRHQRPEAAGRPAPSRRPVETGRGRAARRPHPAAGQRERGSGDLPLRHRRIVRRLYVAGPGNQGPVYLAR